MREHSRDLFEDEKEICNITISRSARNLEWKKVAARNQTSYVMKQIGD